MHSQRKVVGHVKNVLKQSGSFRIRRHKLLHMPNFTKPLENVVLGMAWLWLLLFVGLHGPAVLWLAPLPAHPAALQLDGSILQTCTGVLPKLREGFEVRPEDPAGLQIFLPGWGLAAP